MFFFLGGECEGVCVCVFGGVLFVVRVLEQNVRTRQSTRRRGRRTTRHHNAAQLSTARVGALRPMPHCLGIGSTRVGPGRTPTVHPC